MNNLHIFNLVCYIFNTLKVQVKLSLMDKQMSFPGKIGPYVKNEKDKIAIHVIAKRKIDIKLHTQSVSY